MASVKPLYCADCIDNYITCTTHILECALIGKETIMWVCYEVREKINKLILYSSLLCSASFLAGILGTAATNPMDVIKVNRTCTSYHTIMMCY